MKPRAPTAFYGDELWAITSYFNPASYRRRLANFNTFRQHLPIPLVAVELAYDADFELQEADAEILIQLRGGALLWQKERLLNVALQALPAACRKVHGWTATSFSESPVGARPQVPCWTGFRSSSCSGRRITLRRTGHQILHNRLRQN